MAYVDYNSKKWLITFTQEIYLATHLFHAWHKLKRPLVSVPYTWLCSTLCLSLVPMRSSCSINFHSEVWCHWFLAERLHSSLSVSEDLTLPKNKVKNTPSISLHIDTWTLWPWDIHIPADTDNGHVQITFEQLLPTLDKAWTDEQQGRF